MSIVFFLSVRSAVFAANGHGQAKWPNRHVGADRQIRRLFLSGVVASELVDQSIVKRMGLKQIFCDHESYRFKLNWVEDA